ncbi:MAG: hypothetical protein IJU08_07755 [Bacteroidales bacterium]|nr:hypothetical protein [Bacteroidales bacterium]
MEVLFNLYGPSYVSLHWALRWYGLIPERVETVTSVTTRHTREFENSLDIWSKDYFLQLAGMIVYGLQR